MCRGQRTSSNIDSHLLFWFEVGPLLDHCCLWETDGPGDFWADSSDSMSHLLWAHLPNRWALPPPVYLRSGEHNCVVFYWTLLAATVGESLDWQIKKKIIGLIFRPQVCGYIHKYSNLNQMAKSISLKGGFRPVSVQGWMKLQIFCWVPILLFIFHYELIFRNILFSSLSFLESQSKRHH